MNKLNSGSFESNLNRLQICGRNSGIAIDYLSATHGRYPYARGTRKVFCTPTDQSAGSADLRSRDFKTII
jgi:hypothetical protein